MSGAGTNSRWKGERGPYKRMASGRKFYLADPRPEDFYLPDIIHHLSRLPRYDGATTYTVGQHCGVAAKIARRLFPDNQGLPAKMLIHDFVEAYYGDVSSPLKSLLSSYRVLEKAAELELEKWLGVRFLDDPLVKEIDDRMWLTERSLLFPDIPVEEDYDGPLTAFTELSWAERWALFQPWRTFHVADVLEYEFARAWPEWKK